MKLHSSMFRKIWWQFLTFIVVLFIKLLGSKQKQEEKLDINKLKSILIIRKDKVGDLILATPIFENIKKNLPGVKVTALVRKYNKDVLSNNPYVDEIIEHIKKREFDLTLNLIYDFELGSALACYLSKAPFRVGYKSKNSYVFQNLELESNFKARYELYRNLDLLKFVGFNIYSEKPGLYPSKSNYDKVENFMKENNLTSSDILIGINPGVGRDRRKWQTEKFIELGRKLIAKNNVKVIVTWGKQDKSMAEKLVKLIGDRSVLSLSTSITELAAMISKFKVFVCGNTGPVHVAMAMDVPTVGLYGEGDYENWTPPAGKDENLIIVRGKTCKDISVNEVFTSVERALRT